MLRWLNLQAGFNPFFRQQHVINQPLRGLSLRYGFARYYPGRIADPVSPYPGAALLWLEATPFEISNQFQPLDGGMKRLKTRQRGGNRQHRADQATLND